MINIKKTSIKVLIRTNFIRPVSGQKYHYVTYQFDPNMELEVLHMRNFLFTYLGLLRNLRLEARTSIRELVETCGFKPTSDYRRTSSYRLIEKGLESMVSDGFIEPLSKPFSKYKVNDLIVITFIEENFYMSIRSKNAEDMSNEPFFSINNEEFEKITTAKECDIPKLFYIYCYIKTRIRHREISDSPQEKPEMFFESLESMAERFHVSYKTIQKYMLVLCEIGLLRAGKLTTHTPGKKAPNVYVLIEDGWEIELGNAVHYLDNKRKNNDPL